MYYIILYFFYLREKYSKRHIRGVIEVEKVCPICNELGFKTFECDKCGGTMVDKGRAQEYSDDYTANMPINDSENCCAHIFECTECNFFKRVLIDKEKI